jgi:biopolymer transport protein TolR
MSGNRYRKRPMSEINVVPYIDVMLVLLVIFMITAPLLSQGVQVELPQASAQPIKNSDQEPFVVSVDAAGRFYTNVGSDPEAVIDEETLLARASAVLRNKPLTPVMVRGDRRVDYGHVIRAMTLLQQAGAPSVGLITETPENLKSR